MSINALNPQILDFSAASVFRNHENYMKSTISRSGQLNSFVNA